MKSDISPITIWMECVLNDIEKFYDRFYSLSYIQRYSNVIRIKNESVAEHSFYVALIVLKLADTYNFDVQTALACAIIHDLLEAEINDVTHYTKSKYPKIKEAIDEAEIDAFNSLEEGWIKSYSEFARLHPESNEILVVKLADVIQCSQYANHEMKMGNKGYMKEVYDESIRRKELLEQKLEHCRRHPKK